MFLDTNRDESGPLEALTVFSVILECQTCPRGHLYPLHPCKKQKKTNILCNTCERKVCPQIHIPNVFCKQSGKSAGSGKAECWSSPSLSLPTRCFVLRHYYLNPSPDSCTINQK